MTNKDIIDYTSRMKEYYVSLYYRDANLLTSYFRVPLKLTPQVRLMSMELRELRAEQRLLSRLVQQAAFQKLKALRDSLFQQNKTLFSKKGVSK